MFHHLTEKKINNRAVIYRRKSQEDKSRQILSLSTQADICQSLVEQYQAIVKEEYCEMKSALKAGLRPEFIKMMTRIERGEIDVIICWKIDRLARNMKEGGWIIDLLQNRTLKGIITKEKVYLPEDNTIITAIEMATATEYSRELSKKVLDGNSKKASKGLPNSHAIIGFLNNKLKLQGERDWRDDPQRWHLMRQALKKIIDEDMTPFNVFKWLRNEVKMTTPKRHKLGGKLITHATFYRFIRRPEIAGLLLHDGQLIKINGCITPMITEQQYWLLQARLGKRGHARPKKHVSTYTGYITSPEGDLCTPDSVNRVTCDCTTAFSINTRSVCPDCGKDLSDMKTPKFYFRRYYYNIKRKKGTLGNQRHCRRSC